MIFFLIFSNLNIQQSKRNSNQIKSNQIKHGSSQENYKAIWIEIPKSYLKSYKKLGEINITLKPHQIVALKWLLKQENSYKAGILADDMGLGKTVEILSLLLASPKKKNLIVVPANIVNQWQEAIKKFCTDINLIVHWGPQRINGSSERQ